MNDKNLKQNIQKRVLEKIRNRNIYMRPKAYFILKLVVTIVVGLLAFVISAFVISFVFFNIHESGELFLLGFGDQGIHTFFLLFPWTYFLTDIVILLFLEWLLQSFKFAYRISLLGIFLGIFASSIILGIIINFTPLHKILLDQADKGSLPIVGQLYESIRDSHADQGVFRGVIISIQGNQITITHNDKEHDADDGTRTITLPPTNSLALQVGDRVYVFGTSTNETIKAYGIQKLSAEQ